ncbi:ubiquitin-activating E1 FCCH domain-containing protein [Georhizobium sp. MAB10]|uniref:ubiquitin-activating E1 FCCH domain-containing protein n=1 Tax=Georhizobium sp. MAB10 TaxID=3028319 RepID=UPI003855E069
MPTPLASAPSVNRLGSAAFRNSSRFLPSELCLSPFQFGGKGDGLQDDSGAINAMFDRFREMIGGGIEQKSAVEINMSGGKWRVNDTINGTLITGWNWKMTGGSIYGHCAGKPIMDLSGSRGYEMNGVGFIGDKDSMPRSAWQAARLEESQFCDNVQFADVSTNGYFSEAAWIAYGQETANHHHCTYFNNNHDAYVAIIEGFDAHPFMSEFGTVITGPTSNINISMTGNCDLRYLPAGDIFGITSVTTGANAVIGCPGHEFEIGDQCVFAGVNGMEEMTKVIATVTAKTTNTFTTNANTTGFGTYVSGGVAIRRQTKPTLYIARAEGVSLPDIYLVAYGQPQIKVGFPDETFPRLEMLHAPNALFEGSGNVNNIYFDTDGVPAAQMLGFDLLTYNANATQALLGIGTDSLSFYRPRIHSVNNLWDPALVQEPDQCAMYGGEILYSTLALTRYSNMQSFNGEITELLDGETHTIGKTVV